jgi:Tat protein secretion system quality control protein TatD with DNase activity
MKLIDAHIHLSDAEYSKRRDELVAEVKNMTVSDVTDQRDKNFKASST